MKCAYCGATLSRKVCLIHQEVCPKRFEKKEEIKEEVEVTTSEFDNLTKRDLMVLILSEDDSVKEYELKKKSKKELVLLAEKL